MAIEAAGDAALRTQQMHPMYGLAVLMGEMGRYTEAAQFGRQAWDMARKALPADHPDLLSIETAYANTLATLRQSEAAEPLFRQVIAAETRVLGPEHKHTLLAELALVADLQDQHRDREAAELGLPVARSLDSLLGADNLYALGAWQQYGVAACSSHQEDQGLAALRRVAAARQRIYTAGSRIHAANRGCGPRSGTRCRL
jgi:hypothetical protein